MAYRLHLHSSVDSLADAALASVDRQNTAAQWFGNRPLWIIQSGHLRDWLNYRSADAEGVVLNPEVLLADQGIRFLLEACADSMFQNGQTDAPLPVLFADSISLLIYQALKNDQLPQGLNNWKDSVPRLEEDLFALAVSVADAYHAFALNHNQGDIDSSTWQALIWEKIFEDSSKGLPLGAALERLRQRLVQWSGPSLVLKGPDGRPLKRLIIAGSAFLPAQSIRFLTLLGQKHIVEIDHYLFWPFNQTDIYPGFTKLCQEWAGLGHGLALELKNLGVEQAEKMLPIGSVSLPAQGLRVVACAQGRRQVEVLKEEILALLNQNTDLGANQIAILCPKPEEFRPWFEAIFPARMVDGSLDRRQYDHLDWHFLDIADSPSSFEIAVALLLACPGSTLKRSTLTELLAQPACAQAFGIGPDDVSTIYDWVKKSDSREYLDAEHRQSHNLPALNDNTWAITMERLCQAMLYEQDFADSAYTIIDYQRSHGRIAEKFLNFLAALADLCRGPQWHGERSIEDWATLVRGSFLGFKAGEHDDAPNNSPLIASRFLKADVDDPGPQRLSAAISNLVKRALDLEVARKSITSIKISFSLWRTMLAEHLESGNRSPGQALLRGVCVARFQPFRLIPFKHIFILGMDEGSFPARNEDRPLWCFGPKGQAVKDARSQDLYSMLESLSTCQGTLSFLYQGHDPVSQKRRLPSSIVSSLASVLKLETLRAPLHGFDDQSLSPNLTKPHSSALRAIITAMQDRSTHQAMASLKANGNLELSVDDFTMAITKPLSWFGRRLLGLSLYDAEDELISDDLAFGFEKKIRDQFIRDLLLAIVTKPEMPSIDLWLKARIRMQERQGGYVQGLFFDSEMLTWQSFAEDIFKLVQPYCQSIGTPLGNDGFLRIAPFKQLKIEQITLHGLSGPWFIDKVSEGQTWVVRTIQYQKSESFKAPDVLSAIPSAIVVSEWLKTTYPEHPVNLWRYELWTIQKKAGLWKLNTAQLVLDFASLQAYESIICDLVLRSSQGPFPFYPKILEDKKMEVLIDNSASDSVIEAAMEDWYAENGQNDSKDHNWGMPGRCEYYRLLFQGNQPVAGNFPWSIPGLVEGIKKLFLIVKPASNESKDSNS